MKCTSCKSGTLISAYLDDLFPCYSCSNCEGNLVMLNNYLRWMEGNENHDFISDKNTEITLTETSNAMLCPKTGALMTKYRISKNSDHRLDYSPSIYAIWMDKGEWGLLKREGLAGKLNIIFTKHWQQEINSNKSKEILSGLYKERFGVHYNQIKSFRRILHNMEDKSQVIAYLISDDPYKP